MRGDGRPWRLDNRTCVVPGYGALPRATGPVHGPFLPHPCSRIRHQGEAPSSRVPGDRYNQQAACTSVINGTHAMSFSPDSKISLAVLALVSLLALTAGAGEIHRWTDPDGSVHYGHRPPAGAESDILTLHINTYSAPGIQALEAVFRTDDKVVMYSATWCGVCKRAKRYFEDRQIPFTEYDIETSAKGKQDYRKLGARGVPVILVGQRRLNGFSPAMFESIYRR